MAFVASKRMVGLYSELSPVWAFSNTPMGGGAGMWVAPISLVGWARIVGSVFADVDGTLTISQCNDYPNYDVESVFPYVANTRLGISVEVVGAFARVAYQNGANPQTVFRLNVRGRRI